MTKKLIKIVWLLASTVCVAQQGSVTRESGNWTNTFNGVLTGVRNVHVKVEIGGVHVQGGSSQGVSYVIRNRSYEGSEDRARRQFAEYKVSAYIRGDTAWIVGEWENGRPHKFSSEINISVPRDIELVKIETEGGEIATTDISGRLEAESGGGSIHVDDIGGTINAETGGGSVDVGNVGSDVTVQTGGGSIHIGSAKGKISAESGGGSVELVSGLQGASLQTGGGSIHVDKCTGTLKVSTGGGSIDLGEINGPVIMETGGGGLKLASSTGAVKAETGGGGIELWGVPSARVETGAGAITAKFIAAADRKDSVLETSVGDITVYLVPNLNLTVRASIEAANGHHIISDFPDIKISSEGGPWEKLVSAEGNLNGGGPVLKVRTTMGNIYIRRAQ